MRAALLINGSVVESIKAEQDALTKEIETVRRMTRTNWLMIFNMPLPYETFKAQALQNVLAGLANGPNKTMHLQFFVCQRHHDYMTSAPLRKAMITHNKSTSKGETTYFYLIKLIWLP
ncbi:hypothetical protein Aduo_018351 [Ancylostoma duodenale]